MKLEKAAFLFLDTQKRTSSSQSMPVKKQCKQLPFHIVILKGLK